MEGQEIKHIEINLGKVCNNHCVFCMTKKNDSIIFVLAAEVKKEIDAYSKKGFNSIGFLGGEPTIHPAMSDIICYAKKKGFKKIHLVSNGRMYCSMPFLRALIAAGVTRFSVSIHSHIPKVEDSLTLVNGGFNQKTDGLKNLVKCRNEGLIKDDISVNIVINKKNYEKIIETLSFFRKLGLREFRLNFIRPEGRAFYNFEELVLRYSDFEPYIPRIIDFAEEGNASVSIGDVPFCMFLGIDNPQNFSGEFADYFDLVVSFGNNDKEGVPFKEEFSWKNSRKLGLEQVC